MGTLGKFVLRVHRELYVFILSYISQTLVSNVIILPQARKGLTVLVRSSCLPQAGVDNVKK